MQREAGTFVLFYTPHVYVTSMAGAERRFVEISRQWSKSGKKFSVLELYPGFSKALDVKYDNYRIKTVIPLKQSPFNNLSRPVFWVLQALLLGPILLSTKTYNLILVPLHSIPNTLPAYLLSRIFHLPLVLIIHAPEKPELERDFVKRFKAYRQRGFGRIEGLVWTIVAYVNLKIVQKADGVITVSKVCEKGIKCLGVDSKKIFISSNGINVDYIENLVGKESIEKTYDAAYIGRIAPEKGIIDLTKLWEIIAQKRPSSKLICIGGGSDKNIQTTKREIKERKLENNFILAGFLPDEEAFKKLSASKIFLFLSKGVGGEAFGLAVGEALACGLPVVAYDLEVVKENFNSESVFLVPLDNVEKASQITLKLLEDDQLRIKLGENGRRFVRRFDWRKVAEQDYMFLRKLSSSYKQ